MYLETANTFINVKDIKIMYVNSDNQVIIQYTNDSQTTLNCSNAKDAQDNLMKLSKKAEEVQSVTIADILNAIM